MKLAKRYFLFKKKSKKALKMSILFGILEINYLLKIRILRH